MEFLVLAGVIALLAFGGIRKYKKAAKGKSCCK
jgi:hypothetical protein